MMTFKINKITAALLSTMMCAVACQDVDLSDPDLTTSSTSSHANFVMVNGSQDAPSLDLFVNNLKVGESISANSTQAGYTNVIIPSNGVLANTNLRAKATSATIGGVLGKSDLIFRAANNSTNNFQASDSAYYTLIVTDSIARPKPLRTLNASKIGDITYYSTVSEFTAPKIIGSGDTTIALTSNNSIVTYNLVKKYNGGVAPSFLSAIGAVPLGSTDPGGLRFLVITDQLPLPSATRFPKPAAGKCAVRFIQVSPNTEDNVTVKIGGTSITNSGSLRSFPMKYPTFSPSVGSRSVTLSNYQTLTSGAMDIVVTGAGPTTLAEQLGYVFDDKGVYTVIMSGDRNDVSGSNLLVLSIIKNK
jgi:hypothetical protein